MLAGSNGHKDVTKLLIKYKNKGLKESLLDKLEGPTEEEVVKHLEGLSGFELMKKSIKVGYLQGVIRGMEEYDDYDDVLLLSLQYNFVEGIDYALKNGADKNVKLNVNDFIHNIDDVSILGYCIYYNSIEILDYLLNNYKFTYKEKEEAKQVAIITSNYDLLDFLLEHGAKLDQEDLIWCALENKIEMIDYIIKKGFEVTSSIKDIIKQIEEGEYPEDETIEHVKNKLFNYEKN